MSWVKIGRDGGEPNVLILGRHQFGNQYARQISLTEAVTQEKDIRFLLVQKSLHLIARAFNLGGIDRVFFVAFDQQRCGRAPFRPAKIGIDVIGCGTLIQPSGKARERQRFPLATQVVARVLDGSPWTIIGGLAGGEIGR